VTAENEPSSGNTQGPSRLQTTILIIVVTQLLFAVFLLQRRFDRQFGDYRATEEILYIDNGVALKKALIGFESIAADLYWLRTVQYFGGKRLEADNKDFDLLEPLLDITTDLDPKLKVAYRYGAVFLSEAFPRGQGAPLKGVRLIDKGIANNPEHWRFYLDKGFIYYWYLKDYKKAAEVFLAGSELPDAPYWMIATAGRMLTAGGDRETARELWNFLLEIAENEQMKNNAIIHLQQLDALDGIDILTDLVATYEAQTGLFPESWQELIDAGVLRGLPLDPTGVAFVLNQQEKKVEMSLESELAGLPR
jgi:tetratricopeptide (TPR) repeat protein